MIKQIVIKQSHVDLGGNRHAAINEGGVRIDALLYGSARGHEYVTPVRLPSVYIKVFTRSMPVGVEPESVTLVKSPPV
jgi:hypothetical protein